MVRTLGMGALVALSLLAVPAVAAARLDDAARARRCQAAKLAAVGRYQLCLADAEAHAVMQQTQPVVARCDRQLRRRWEKAERRGGGTCPTTSDLARVRLASTRHGARIASQLGAVRTTGTCSGVPFAYSYMVTNRATPFATAKDAVVPGAPGSLTFWTASGAYQSSDPQSTYTEVTETVFLERLQADLALAASAGRLHLGLYVHGLGNLFTEALAEAAAFGCALERSGQWPGLLIGFSWPSYDLFDSAYYYASSGPPPPPLTPQTSGTIRDNVLGSRQSFDALVQLLGSRVVAPSATPVTLSFLTHSEGNYMLMTGLAALTQPAQVDRCLMLAADVSAVSLQSGEQGAAIAATCAEVTVYYSGADETLGSSNYEFFPYHRSDYPTRLGLIGPYYGFLPPKALAPNVVGLDCSSVTVAPAVASIIDVHSSYRTVPAILRDQAETMLSLPHPKRHAISGTSQGFTLAP
ncbi:MAG: alpha/beta hydrolase [bacterium]|nr:alpha/beta hydrolase [bacterium]